MEKQIGYFRNNYHTQMRFTPYIADKNYIQYNHRTEYEGEYNPQKEYNKAMSTNYGLGMTSTMQPQLRSSWLPQPTFADYEQAQARAQAIAQAEANNFNFSINQFLRLPYQIVMPQTEINQSISISNLPSLNDLAIRTGINTGMGSIFAPQRQMTAPSPVPLQTPQLLLPLSSFYNTNCQKDHLQLPNPWLEDHQKYLFDWILH